MFAYLFWVLLLILGCAWYISKAVKNFKEQKYFTFGISVVMSIIGIVLIVMTMIETFL